jgi:hypothetical protein
MSPILTDIRGAMSRNETFSITKNPSGDWQITKPSVWNRILFWKDKTEENTRIRRIAKVLNEELRAMPRMEIKASLKNDALKVARNFLRSISPEYFAQPHVNDCCRQLLAAKLGIETKVFAKNPGFEQFAYDSHLERYLADYGHEIRVDPKTMEISLLCEGNYLPWSDISERLKQWDYPEKNLRDNPRQEWLYGNEGIQKKDLYAWHTLKPYKKVLPTWGDRYLFEFCVCCNPSFSLNGDHSWLELKTPEGEIYSTGLYRPGKSHFFDSFHYPLRVKKGYLMSPDVSNWWPTPIHRLPVVITKEQFLKIKQSIEEDKQKEDSRHFQLFNGNCQEYVNEKAALADIKLNTSMYVLRNVTPINMQRVYDRIMARLPALVHKICLYTATFFLNLTQWILGATLTDKQLKVKGVKVKPYLKNFRDLFNPKKLHFHPPRHLGLTIRKQIEEWRHTKMEALEPEDPERETLRYALPSELRINKALGATL